MARASRGGGGRRHRVYRDQHLAAVHHLTAGREHRADLEGGGRKPARAPPGQGGVGLARVVRRQALDHGPVAHLGRGRVLHGHGPAGAGADLGATVAIGQGDQAAVGAQRNRRLAAHDLDGDQGGAAVGEQKPAGVEDAELVLGRGLVGPGGSWPEREPDQRRRGQGGEEGERGGAREGAAEGAKAHGASLRRRSEGRKKTDSFGCEAISRDPRRGNYEIRAGRGPGSARDRGRARAPPRSRLSLPAAQAGPTALGVCPGGSGSENRAMKCRFR